MWDRRTFLGSSLAALGLGASGVALASPGGEARLVVLLLRGGLDGLAAVPPLGDPDHDAARGGAAVGDALVLDGFFALHPALAPIQPWFAQGDLALVHATAVPYDERSHFSAQDVLENGTTTRGGRRDGWLGRSLDLLGRPMAASIGQELPLLLRGGGAFSLDPGRRRQPAPQLLAAVQGLYAGDPVLGEALAGWAQARELLELAGAPPGSRSSDPLAATGRLLALDEGPRVAVIPVDGWDTHTNQAGRLERALGGLADGLVALRSGLGASWEHTVVLALTEFGRTVAANGTGGTDHGVGGVALLAGGAVQGGVVHSDWPGLAPADLLDRRDLRSTTDLRALLKGVLRDHLGLVSSVLDREVFPESAAVAAMDGLVRA